MDINFLKQEQEKDTQKNGPSVRGFLFLLFLTIAVLFSFGSIIAINRNAGKDGTHFLTTLGRLLVSSEIALAGERDDRINILLLGIGGEGHDGAFLSDTILLASVQPSTKTVALLSIPRDLSVSVAKNEWRKINSVSAAAESIEPGSGGEAMRNALENLLQVSISYVVRVDFEGFEQFIDTIGGITVTVENRIDDPRYPIKGNEHLYPITERYEHFILEPGTYAMDGSLALKYVRSRRGYGVEGSDFARLKRQQNILLAVYEKVFSWPTLTNPSRLRRIMNNLADHVTTNIAIGEGIRLAKILKGLQLDRIRRIALSDAENGFLTARIVNGAYILEPRDGTFDTIRALVQNIFTSTPPPPPPQQKRIRVAILNGTTITGLAKTISEILATQDFVITHVGNAPAKPVAETILYDLTDGKEFLATDRLRLLLNALPSEERPAQLIEAALADSPADFIIILGENTKLP